MDNYYRDVKRDTFEPLLKQMSDDMLRLGFKDVGPQITKLTIKDDDITQFIDEFICFYYDSSTTSLGNGASGIATVSDDSAGNAGGASYSTFLLDGIGSARLKTVDDVYDDIQWNKYFATEMNSNLALTGDKKYMVGQNAELFSFLNPHPNRRGALAADLLGGTNNITTAAEINFGKSWNQGVKGATGTATKWTHITDIATPGTANTGAPSTTKYGQYSTESRPIDLKDGHFYKLTPEEPEIDPILQKGYIGIAQLSKAIYLNEFNKIKNIMTNNARDVVFLPEVSSGINTEAKLRNYKLEPQTDGTILHHFWVSNFKDEFFFPAGTIEPKRFTADFLVGFTAASGVNNFQQGDSYAWTFTHTPAVGAVQTLSITVVIPVDNSLQGVTKAVFDQMIASSFADPKGGLYSATLSSTTGVIEISARDIGDNLTLASGTNPVRTARTQTSFGYSATADAAFTEFDVVQPSVLSTVNGAGGPVTTATYKDGYVHEVQIRGIEGANIDDLFTIKITGLLDENAADILDPSAIKTVTVSHRTTDNYNSSEIAEVLAAALKADPYIKSYMTVLAGSNTVTIKYKSTSRAYLRKSETGSTFGLQNFIPTNAGVVGGAASGLTGTIGSNSSFEHSLNGFPVADLPTQAEFDVVGTYVVATLAGSDMMETSLQITQAGVGNSVSKVRLSFPLARDLGTLANPVYGNYVVQTGLNPASKTSYSVSYAETVLQAHTGAQKRPNGPEVSFDALVLPDHPNVTHSSQINGQTGFKKFKTYTHELNIESFEYISDHSMGPVVLETDSTNSLSGPNGDQPWRIRLDITRGKEVREASPYINESVLQIKSDTDASNGFEYLKVHVATEFQLKSNGDVVQVEGVDGIKEGKLREPGHLGALRTQYNGYQESAAHLVNPFVNQKRLEATLTSGFNYLAGVVGTRHLKDDFTASTGVQAIFPVATADQVNVPQRNTLVTTASPKVALTFGRLDDNEYRYEEEYLVGTSSELIHDTPFNSGSLRLQKGLFRRTGKSHPDIAPAYPMAYTLTITKHGIAFYLKDQASVTQSDDSAFFLVQRHVNAAALTTGPATSRPAGTADFISEQQPVHCLYATSEPPILFSDSDPFFSEKSVNRQDSISLAGIYDINGNYLPNFKIDELKNEELRALELETQGRFRRFVVREKDVLKPWDRHVFAGVNETDSFAILNPLEQLSLNDEGQLIIQFPNRLGTQRFFYTNRELDMIGFCAAGAIGQDTLISSDRYSTGDVATSASSVVDGVTVLAETNAAREGGAILGNNNHRRMYRGMMSTGAFGNGMRILMLVAGSGITTTDADTAQIPAAVAPL